MASSIIVLLVLGVFNFVSSIIQGVAGIGDAIFMQVLWFLACGLWPDLFLHTALGEEPVRAVALIMYIRLLFMSPLVVYLGLNDSIFSKTMTIMMAIPSTILSIIGVLLFKKLDGAVLKKVLGITSFLFAVVYMCIIVYRQWRKRRRVEVLRARRVKLVVEADALAEEAERSLNTSMVNLHASFVQNVPNNSIFAINPPNLNGPDVVVPNMFTSELPANTNTTSADVQIPGSTLLAEHQPAQEAVIDARTGLSADTTEAFLDTIGGDLFVAPETRVPQVNEENVPPLSPSKLSPSRTMTYTRVRINRNIDANGKVKMSTKIGAAVAASIAGIMASLTGVNAPPQIIFILLYDAPNYIVRVNFSAQSIPSNIIRFFMAVAQGSFTWEMAPLLISVVVFGFAGVFVGNKIGRLLGPNSFNIFVLCLLLLCSLAMMGSYQNLLIFSTIFTIVLTVACGYLENKKNKPLIEKQRVSELQVEKRLYDCLEELERNNNSFIGHPISSPTTGLEHMQRATRPKPLWGGANPDNDDDVGNDHDTTQHAREEKDEPIAAADDMAPQHTSPTTEAKRVTKRRSSSTSSSASSSSSARTSEKPLYSAVDRSTTQVMADRRGSQHTTAGPRSPIASVSGREVADESVPNVNPSDAESAAVVSIHSSAISSGANSRAQVLYPPITLRSAPQGDLSKPAETHADPNYRLEQQSPSLHSLNSSVQETPTESDQTTLK